MPSEPWDWRKALYGMVDPTRLLKDGFTLLRMVVIGIIAYLLFVGAVAIWKKWVPQPKPKLPVVTTTGNITGGDKCKLDLSSGEKEYKWGIITF